MLESNTDQKRLADTDLYIEDLYILLIIVGYMFVFTNVTGILIVWKSIVMMLIVLQVTETSEQSRHSSPICLRLWRYISDGCSGDQVA
mmetsp:Transcript_1436/g.2326  ORF Transcript_1436/g.2326 Transcript_1436/m.2326 type:complete len:88 (+) Transcript_1436:184-447(+)